MIARFHTIHNIFAIKSLKLFWICVTRNSTPEELIEQNLGGKNFAGSESN